MHMKTVTKFSLKVHFTLNSLTPNTNTMSVKMALQLKIFPQVLRYNIIQYMYKYICTYSKTI